MKKSDELQKRGCYVLLLFFLGFLIGVITTCIWQEKWLVEQGFLNQEFIYQIEHIDMDKRALLFLCMGKRIRAFLLLWILSYSTVNLFSTSAFFVLNGIYVGGIMEALAIRYGWKGFLLYMGMILPHGILYSVGFSLLGVWCLRAREENIRLGRMGKLETSQKELLFFSLGMVIGGIFLESYINPEILFFVFDMI